VLLSEEQGLLPASAREVSWDGAVDAEVEAMAFS
jgi:hypothetical protein